MPLFFLSPTHALQLILFTSSLTSLCFLECVAPRSTEGSATALPSSSSFLIMEMWLSEERGLLYPCILSMWAPKSSKNRVLGSGHLMRREDFLEKMLMLEKCEGRRRRGRQRMRWTDSVIEATNMNLTQLREAMEDRRAWRALVHWVTKSRTWLND